MQYTNGSGCRQGEDGRFRWQGSVHSQRDKLAERERGRKYGKHGVPSGDTSGNTTDDSKLDQNRLYRLLPGKEHEGKNWESKI